jgi:hypothetical protein
MTQTLSRWPIEKSKGCCPEGARNAHWQIAAGRSGVDHPYLALKYTLAIRRTSAMGHIA